MNASICWDNKETAFGQRQRLVVVEAVLIMIQKMMSVCLLDHMWSSSRPRSYEQHVVPATPKSLVFCAISWMTMPRNLFPAQFVHTVWLCAMGSHLKATLLDVVKLQAKGLYAAYDSPLMANQTDSNTSDVTEERGEKR